MFHFISILDLLEVFPHFFLTAVRYVLISHFIPDFGNGQLLLINISLLRHLPILLIVLKNQHFTDFLFCSFLFLLSLISVPFIIIAYLLLCSGCILHFLIFEGCWDYWFDTLFSYETLSIIKFYHITVQVLSHKFLLQFIQFWIPLDSFRDFFCNLWII